ncbi:hypothetical protein EPH95_01290 [Salicibibacter halophilus]|uniref:Sporulation protein YpjB n=1 Tax=Salicibibacter halophilus TaxID=2502791 RepID=A0A514LFE9_9BACI|nr:sporulation protein YpjB [Salicibibacter halophilus]QDI89971.1 hypothetical protein EPH95_01290 [Salicibibacter halophilus]
MRGWLIMLAAVIFLIGIGAEQEEQGQEDWAYIDAEAEEIVTLVQSENYEEGRARLQALADDLTAADYEAMALDVHDMGTIIMSYERLAGGLTEVSLARDERLAEAMGFHYAVDAVLHPENPKWKETRHDVEEQLAQLRDAASEGGSSFQHAWNDWRKTFEMIHPAATLRLSPSEREEVRTLVSFMDEHSHRLKDEKEAQPFFDALEKQMIRLYEGDIEENDPSLITVIAIVGGAILLSLSYAGWKKYRGEARRGGRRRDR